jgi:hypothetical protein
MYVGAPAHCGHGERDVLNNIYDGRWTNCMVSTLTRLQSFWFLFVGTPQNPAHAGHFENETISIYPWHLFERMWRSVMRCVELCTDPMEDILST